MMKLLFITSLILLIDCAFCTIDKGKYLELENTDKEAYLVAENCEKVYICSDHSKSDLLGLFGDDILDECYYRSKRIGAINVDDGPYTNPNKCSIKGYANISTNDCTLSSSGSVTITKGEFSTASAAYYDIDIVNNRVLTNYGWCTYKYENIDTE